MSRKQTTFIGGMVSALLGAIAVSAFVSSAQAANPAPQYSQFCADPETDRHKGDDPCYVEFSEAPVNSARRFPSPSGSTLAFEGESRAVKTLTKGSHVAALPSAHSFA